MSHKSKTQLETVQIWGFCQSVENRFKVFKVSWCNHAMCHVMICDVSWCANLRLLLIFWNLWRLLLQRLMYLKHQACDHCDSLFNEFNVFCEKNMEIWKVHDPVWSCKASWLRRAPFPWGAHEGLEKNCRFVQPSKSRQTRVNYVRPW